MQYKHFTTSIVALVLAGAVQAAELGDIVPRSYIGQPLAVDIDLVSLTPEEVNGLQVRLAAQDVYRGANVSMNPALASVRMQVERRGGKPVLHVATTRPVEADYLHLYVELGVPGKQEVRLATVWLQPDPNPPPPVAVAPAAPAVPLASAMTPAQAEQIAAQARAARAAASQAAGKPAAVAAGAAAGAVAADASGGTAARTGAGTAGAAPASAPAAGTGGAGGVAGAAAPARDRSKPAPLPSVHEAETGVPGEVKAAAQARRIAGVLVSPDGKPIKPSAREESAEVPVGVSQALLPLAPLPLPKGVKRPASASCPAGGITAKECVALDNHNTEISSKLTELEGKLKALQGALGGAAPAAKGAAPAAGHGEGPASAATAKAAPGAMLAAAAARPGAASATSDGAKPAASAAAPAAAEKQAASGAGQGKASADSATGAAAGQLSASMAAQGETEMHAAKVAASETAASAAASAASASVPTKQVRVLPKLKYKKEKDKPAEQTSSSLPLIAGGAGLLALLGGGFVLWRKKKAGKGPLKIWQGFRKKKVEEPEEEFKPVPEPASSAS